MNLPDISPKAIVFMVVLTVLAGIGFGLYERNNPSTNASRTVEQPK